jgi:hypothetical protein
MVSMAKKPVAKFYPEKLKSGALKNLENNFDDVLAFMERIRTDELNQAAKRLKKSIEKETASIPKINVKRLTRSVEAYGQANEKWLAFYRPANRWMTVMLVTFLEGYLEDVLIEIARKNPQLVKDVAIDARSVFQIASIEELRDEVRRQWAHNELRPDGPRRWYRAIKDRGAKQLDQSIIHEMQHLWDTRNLIVHGKGIIDASYAAKYSDRGAKRGQQVGVGTAAIQRWLERISKFVDWVDEFCLSYCKNKRA